VVAPVAGLFGAFFSHRSADIARDGQQTVVSEPVRNQVNAERHAADP